jgi:hypothetical protein
MGMRAPVTIGTYHVGPTDWADVKRRIIAALGPAGVYSQFRDLGLRIEGPYNSKGKATCHAMGREDANPSGFINVSTGIYHSKGESVETLNLFDFALKYGGAKFGDWLGTIKHFADLAGIEVDARKDGKGRVIEAVYDYTDEAGEVLYQVLRYRMGNGKKDFRQRRPDGRGNWVYDLEGTRRVLYGMPNLVAHPDAMVYVVEGEKDADRLNELFAAGGVPAIATTSAQGSNDTGRWESYSESLQGRNCVVIPDCDPTGLRHARGICGYLHGVAASVKLIELPGVGPKGDVSDWLDQDNVLDDLWAIVCDTPPYDPSTSEAVDADADAERDATAADLIAANAGTRWLWPQWIPLGVLTLLTAEPSTGKTRFGLDLTRRIANGLAWPDGQPMDIGDRRPVVLWIPADSQHSELADSPAAFGFPPDSIVLNTSVGDLYGGTELQEEEQLQALEDRINRQMPALVLIDTITNTSDAKSQDTADAKRQYKPLQEIAKRTGAAIVCVTHTNVAGKTLGRRADEKTRVTIRLECPDPENQPSRRKLSVALSRLSVYPQPLGVTMGDGGNDYDADPPKEPAAIAINGQSKGPSPAQQRAIAWLAAYLDRGPAPVQKIRDDAEQAKPDSITSKPLYEAKRLMGIEEFERARPGSTQLYKWWRLPEYHEGNGACF